MSTRPALFLRDTSLLRPLFLRLFFGGLTLLSLLAWYSIDSEAEPWSILPGKQESTRFTTLSKIADSANHGLYFQMGAGIPMEHEWEDLGQDFLLVLWGMLKKHLVLGLLNPFVDPYRVELFVILFPLCLIFFTPLFKLPRWYWPLAAIFFLWAVFVPKYPLGWEHIQKINGLLYLSISTRWLKVLSGFWAFTMTVQALGWWREGSLLEWDRKKIFTLYVEGLVMGVFWSIRKDMLVTSGLALLSCWTLLAFLAPRREKKTGAQAGFQKKAAFVALAGGLILAGCFTIRGAINGAFLLRDRSYPMQKVSRIYGRPVWHSLCAGFGVVPNRYGITWGDLDVWNIIQKRPENKGISYGTVEHERAARKLYFEIITQDPGLLLRNLKFKAESLWFDHHNGISRALVAIAILFFLGNYERWLGVILLSNIVTGTVILLAVNQWLHYGLDLISHYRLAQLIGAGAVILKCGGLFLPKAAEEPSPKLRFPPLGQKA